MTMQYLTKEAAEGYDHTTAAMRDPANNVPPSKACPYLATSASFNAWQVGRHLALMGEDRPTPEFDDKPAEDKRICVRPGRGSLISLRGRKMISLGYFDVQPDGSVRPKTIR